VILVAFVAFVTFRTRPTPVPERLLQKPDPYPECKTIRDHYLNAADERLKDCEIVEWEGCFDPDHPPPKPAEGAGGAEVNIYRITLNYVERGHVAVRLRAKGPRGDRAHLVFLRNGKVVEISNLGPYPL
jgi:hypothetical protein